MDFSLKYKVAEMVGSGPELMVFLVAGFVCLRRLSSRPREGWLVICAVTAYLFSDFGVSTLIERIIHLVPGFRAPSDAAVNALYIVPASIFHAAAWGLLLYAAFGEGSGPRSKYLIEPAVN